MSGFNTHYDCSKVLEALRDESIFEDVDRIQRLFGHVLCRLESLGAEETYDEPTKTYSYSKYGYKLASITPPSKETRSANFEMTFMTDLNEKLLKERDEGRLRTSPLYPFWLAYRFCLDNNLNDDVWDSYPTLIYGYLAYKLGISIDSLYDRIRDEAMAKLREDQNEKA